MLKICFRNDAAMKQFFAHAQADAVITSYSIHYTKLYDGGNAKGFTRTMTTAMALEYDKGEFVLAVALGLTLLVIAFILNTLFHFFQGRTHADTV